MIVEIEGVTFVVKWVLVKRYVLNVVKEATCPETVLKCQEGVGAIRRAMVDVLLTTAG